MPQAAPVGSPVSHVALVATGLSKLGLLLGGAGGAATSFAGLLAGGLGFSGQGGAAGEGIVAAGSNNVIVNNRPAGRVRDPVSCHAAELVALGSDSVFINTLPAARVGDPTTGGAVIVGGSPNVFIGGGKTSGPDLAGIVPPCLAGAAASGAPFLRPGG